MVAAALAAGIGAGWWRWHGGSSDGPPVRLGVSLPAVVFSASEGGAPYSIFWQAADGSAAAERLTTAPAGSLHNPEAASPDGSAIVYRLQNRVIGPRAGGLWVLPLRGEHQPRPLLTHLQGEQAAAFSPDGHWIAYAAIHEGGSQIFVQPYPQLSDRWQISNAGGSRPHWTRGGRELVYLSVPDFRWMAVEIAAQPRFRASRPVELFHQRLQRQRQVLGLLLRRHERRLHRDRQGPGDRNRQDLHQRRRNRRSAAAGHRRLRLRRSKHLAQKALIESAASRLRPSSPPTPVPAWHGELALVP